MIEKNLVSSSNTIKNPQKEMLGIPQMVEGRWCHIIDQTDGDLDASDAVRHS